jgi:hypothetical protein
MAIGLVSMSRKEIDHLMPQFATRLTLLRQMF